MRVGQEGFLGGASRQGSARRKEWQEATSPWGGTLVRSLQFIVYLSTEEDRWGPQTCRLLSRQPPPCRALSFKDTPAARACRPSSGGCCLCQLPAQAAYSQRSMRAGMNFVICFLRVHTGWRVAGSLQHTQLDCPLCPLPQAGSRRFCVRRPSSMGPTPPGPR